MSTGTTWQTKSTSSETTERLAEKIGRAFKGGEVVELISDLGGGKTTFVRGLARGAGSNDKVSSPTFTISKIYNAGDLHIYHFDFYRLHEAGIMADELAEAIHDPRVVIVVEWADVVSHVLPENRLTVHISQTPDGARDITFTTTPQLQYLIEKFS